MPKKDLKLKRFTASFLAVLSLLASSVAACACAHHQAKPIAETSSCHEHSAEKQSAETPETAAATVSENGCVCFQPAPKIAVKSENLKVEKHLAALPPVKPLEVVSVEKTIAAKIDFSKPFYLSDSFYNISPGRAPPVL